MIVTLKTAFSLLDGRLSTEIGDVYKMLNYVFSENFMTHQLPPAMIKLKEVNPEWFADGKKLIEDIKTKHQTNDFNDLMKIIDEFYSDRRIILEKIDGEPFSFFDGLENLGKEVK